MNAIINVSKIMLKDKAIPVTGCGGPWYCDISRILYFLDNESRDGSDVASLKSESSSIPRKIRGTNFC
jgi:hypothetical protein